MGLRHRRLYVPVGALMLSHHRRKCVGVIACPKLSRMREPVRPRRRLTAMSFRALGLLSGSLKRLTVSLEEYRNPQPITVTARDKRSASTVIVSGRFRRRVFWPRGYPVTFCRGSALPKTCSECRSTVPTKNSAYCSLECRNRANARRYGTVSRKRTSRAAAPAMRHLCIECSERESRIGALCATCHVAGGYRLPRQ